jgi:uncharacterized membrane protein
MPCIQKSIEVYVPARTAYNQWTQFEEFPRFMEGVEKVEQLDEANLRWCAKVGGRSVEWDARITEQIPDKRIAWRSTSGAVHSGVVDFHRLSDESCQVSLQIDYQPEGVLEHLGDAFGVVSARTEGDLRRFKEFIETRGVETGAYRGSIPSADDDPGR